MKQIQLIVTETFLHREEAQRRAAFCDIVAAYLSQEEPELPLPSGPSRT